MEFAKPETLPARDRWTHELAHNEYMDHEYGFMNMMQTLFVKTQTALFAIIEKQDRGETPGFLFVPFCVFRGDQFCAAIFLAAETSSSAKSPAAFFSAAWPAAADD